MILTHWFLSLANHLCFILDSFSDVVVVCSHSSPCHGHGDHSRWPSEAWLNHPPPRLHSLFSVLSWWRGVCVAVLACHYLFSSLYLGFAMCQIILMQQNLLKYHTLAQRGWFRWWDHLILQLRNGNPNCGHLEREMKWQWGHVCEFHTVSWILHFH